eukprot:297331-Rhodomonas_salina.1
MRRQPLTLWHPANVFPSLSPHPYPSLLFSALEQAERMFSVLTQFHRATAQSLDGSDNLSWPNPGMSYYAYPWNPWQYGPAGPATVDVKSPDVSEMRHKCIVA